MLVRKILNNNVITSNGEDGQEIIIVGNGIGWKQKVGEPVDESKIDKIFRMDTVSSTAPGKLRMRWYAAIMMKYMCLSGARPETGKTPWI